MLDTWDGRRRTTRTSAKKIRKGNMSVALVQTFRQKIKILSPGPPPGSWPSPTFRAQKFERSDDSGRLQKHASCAFSLNQPLEVAIILTALCRGFMSGTNKSTASFSFLHFHSVGDSAKQVAELSASPIFHLRKTQWKRCPLQQKLEIVRARECFSLSKKKLVCCKRPVAPRYTSSILLVAVYKISFFRFFE